MRFRSKDDVRFRVVGDEGVVVRQKDAEVLALNGVGARVLTLLREERTLEDVVETLVEEYEVDRTELTRDVEQFARELVEAGIVEEAR